MYEYGVRGKVFRCQNTTSAFCARSVPSRALSFADQRARLVSQLYDICSAALLASLPIRSALHRLWPNSTMYSVELRAFRRLAINGLCNAVWVWSSHVSMRRLGTLAGVDTVLLCDSPFDMRFTPYFCSRLKFLYRGEHCPLYFLFSAVEPVEANA